MQVQHRLFWILLILLLVRAGIEYSLYNYHFGDNDQSLYWLGVHDLVNGKLPPLFIYGQDYNYFIEPWLAAPLVLFGLSPIYALAIVTIVMSLAPFLAFAFAAMRKENYNSAYVWLLIPLLMPSGWYIITGMPRGFVNGLFLLSFWPMIQRLNSLKWRWLLNGIVYALAICANPNAFPFALALALFQVFEQYKNKLFWIWTLAGAVLVFSFHLLVTNYAHKYPELLSHHLMQLVWEKNYLVEALKQIESWLRWIVPGNLGIWFLLLLVALACGICIRSGNYRVLAVCIAVLCFLIFSLGINKLHDGREHLHYPFGRMFLAIPLLIALFCDELKISRRALFIGGSILIVPAFYSLGAPSAAQQSDIYPVRIMSFQQLREQAACLRAVVKKEQPDLIIGSGYPQWMGDQQILFHFAEINYSDLPLMTMPNFERRKPRFYKSIAPNNYTRILMFGGDAAKEGKLMGNGMPFHAQSTIDCIPQSTLLVADSVTQFRIRLDAELE